MFRKIKYGIKNVIAFLPLVWRFRPWDYQYNVDILVKSLRMTAKYIHDRDRHIGSKDLAAEINRGCDILEKDFVDLFPDDETKLVFTDSDDNNVRVEIDASEKWVRVSNKLNLWHNARLHTLGKIFKNYESWWD